MNSTFGRMFTLFGGLILFSIMVLGCAFNLLTRSYLVDDKVSMLYNNAEKLAVLATAYNTSGELETNWDFRMSLSLVSEVAETDAIVCDETGSVILCSCDTPHCEHIGMMVDDKYVQRIIENGTDSSTGYVSGLYSEERFVVATPVVSDWTGEPIGIIIVSAPQTNLEELVSETTDIFVLTAFVVLLLSMVLIYVLAKNLCMPLKELSTVARRFGHGDLKARINTDKTVSVEIDELNVAFNNMATSLEKSERQRQEFVANVSHELKTPMTTIGGFMDGMLDGTIPPEEHRKYMTIVAEEVRRLSRLVRSMLEISRLQDRGIPEEKKTQFDLCEAAGQVLITFEQKINAKHLEVQVDFPEFAVYTRAAEDAITQVIYNLVDNAVKFCNEGGCLGMRVRQDDVKAYLSISNTGVTVPPEELSLIFDRFHKTDKSRSMDRDGVGLGLYIVKTIIGSHGEDISVTSYDGVTTFTFTLPLVK